MGTVCGVCVCVLLVMRFSSALSEMVVLGDASPHRSLCVYVNVCLDVFAYVQTSKGSWGGGGLFILILITISQSVSNSLKILFYIIMLQIWLGWAAARGVFQRSAAPQHILLSLLNEQISVLWSIIVLAWFKVRITPKWVLFTFIIDDPK